ncbi:MAG: glycosyltransferase family 4 protein [Candidatus Aminicenantes bacterium]|nr:glycosyltransferase family 4 protein [Candidatus Aminicenantes bacterium]
MKQVFLYHGGQIQPYRIGVYNYLHDYLKKSGYYLTVVSENVQPDGHLKAEFPEIRMTFSFGSLVSLVKEKQPWGNILFINHRARYFYPFLLFLRIYGYKTITWTHGLNLQNKSDKLSRLAHHLEHALCHRIILYSDDLKRYLLKKHRKKVFVANNTLNLSDYVPVREKKEDILKRYHISTRKNIVYSGRIDPRKRIYDLLEAFELIEDNEVGLIIIGPDDLGILEEKYKKSPRIFYLGPLYGKEALDLLSASDVCCIPGAVGLGIVDSMYCGLPLVTEDVNHGPEIMYFKEGINGYMVKAGEVPALAEKLTLVLHHPELRDRLGQAARNEILSRGHINKLSEGFLACLKSLE